jgi:hypothetical protein
MGHGSKRLVTLMCNGEDSLWVILAGKRNEQVLYQGKAADTPLGQNLHLVETKIARQQVGGVYKRFNFQTSLDSFAHVMNTFNEKLPGFFACFMLAQGAYLADKRVVAAGNIFDHVMILPESTIISKFEAL